MRTLRLRISRYLRGSVVGQVDPLHIPPGVEPRAITPPATCLFVRLRPHCGHFCGSSRRDSSRKASKVALHLRHRKG